MTCMLGDYTRILIIVAALSAATIVTSGKADEAEMVAGPKNFIFFGRERERIAESTFLENEQIMGAQLKYTWRELEPGRDRYEFRPLLNDLVFLESHGKRLFVQIQDVSFSEDVPIPNYL